MVMYRLSLLSASNTDDQPALHHTQRHLKPIRIGAIKKLHKAAIGGIVAVEFLPGYNSRVVSIGHDGRCRLVDFEGGPQVLRT
jgi:hypothetical protein